ncbi:MAG TPA: GvpL/GvpF family gas vesicle protein [Baekduia sp.]|nr:GvpL/GvpF family gas vesicle protein [Baekduia sp.]
MSERPERDADWAWASEVLPRLVNEARVEAEAEVRARLRTQIVDALLAVASHREQPDHPARPEPAERDVALRPRTDAARPVLSGTGLWIYGVMDGDAAVSEVGPGVDGSAPVELLRHAGLAALLSEVPLADFGEESLRAGLEDLDRVEALARAHDHVLEAALATGTVIPFRMCTIYETPDHVREMLESRRGPFVAALRRLDGSAEWGVKAFLVLGPESVAERQAAASGVDYLARKREQREAAEEARMTSEAAVAAIHAQVAEQADAAVLGRAQDRGLSGRDAEMVLNASYLVSRERADRLRHLIDELSAAYAEHGIALELTGPWPPYHFVDDALAA